MEWLSGYGTRKEIIIDYTKIDTDLYNFPVLVSFTSNNFNFDKSNITGADIRFTSCSGSSLLKYERETHNINSLSAKYWVNIPFVASGTDTKFYVYYSIDGSVDGADPTHVWDSNFKLVYHFIPTTSGLPILDSTSNTNDGTTVNEPNWFKEYELSNDINCHQGVAYDGTYFYGFDTGAIRKYNFFWTEIATNLTPHTDINSSTNHLGDGCYCNNKLYIVAEDYTHPCVAYSNQYITVWDTSDLSFISKHSVSAQGVEVAGIAVDPNAGTNGTLYIVSYCDGSKIWKYDLSAFAYLGSIVLSQSITSIQGITLRDSFFYISEGDSDSIWKVKEDGTVLGKVYTGLSEAEGIESFEDKLILLIDTGADEKLHFLEPAGMLDCGLDLNGTTQYVDVGIGTGLNPGTGDFTIEVLFNSENTTWRTLYTKRKSTVTSIISLRQANTLNFGIYCKDSAANSKSLYTDDTVNDGVWHYGAVTRNGNNLSIILDLITKNDSGTLDNIDVGLAKSIIGMKGEGDSSDYFDGLLDEIRISGCVRNESWRKATYYSINDSLLSYGNEELGYYFSGYVLEEGSPVSRKVCLHNRDDGNLITITTSSGNGYYYMETSSSGSHYIVCLDDDAGVEYNDLIIGSAVPTEIV
jgi:hypothetical protein